MPIRGTKTIYNFVYVELGYSLETHGLAVHSAEDDNQCFDPVMHAAFRQILEEHSDIQIPYELGYSLETHGLAVHSAEDDNQYIYLRKIVTFTSHTSLSGARFNTRPGGAQSDPARRYSFWRGGGSANAAKGNTRLTEIPITSDSLREAYKNSESIYIFDGATTPHSLEDDQLFMLA